VGIQVESEIAREALAFGGDAGAFATEDGSVAGDELALVERLGQVIVGARLEARHDVVARTPRREDEHRDVVGGRVALQLLTESQAVPVREPQVQHDQDGPVGMEGPLAFGEGGGGLDLKVVLEQHVPGQGQDGGVVLDDEDGGLVHGRFSWLSA
jgi:hypothetical protein